MFYNKRDDRQSGGRSFGKRDFGSRGGFRQMHKAVCSTCKRDCEVPFEPSGDKPVYCNTCFRKDRGDSDTGRFEDRNFRKPHFEDRERRPSYEDRGNRQTQNNEQYNLLNTKLDKILSILNSGSFVKATPKPKIQAEPLIPVEPIVKEKKKKTPPKKVIVPSEVQ